MNLRLRARMNELTGKFNSLPRDMYTHFKSITPIDTGNARSKTEFNVNRIEGNYPYAARLNEGYSRQAPSGMTDPTIEYARDQLRKF